jgi:uncharacterized protein (UPF0218 family)
MSAEPEIQEAVAQETQAESKPSGYDPVDISSLPDEVRKPLEDRLGYLYRQTKTNETSVRQYRDIAAQQSALIEELRKNVGQVVGHIQSEKNAEQVSTLEAKVQEAFEAGDIKAFTKAQTELISHLSKQPQKEEVRENLGKPAQNVRQLSQEAVQGGEISPQDAQYMEAWGSEIDERGELVRPWTENPGGVEDPNPDFVKAVMVAEKFVIKNPTATIQQITAHVDQQMGVRRTANQTVMGGNLTMPRKAARINLTPKQQEIAVRTKFGGPGKSDAEHLEAYRKQIETVKGPKR